MDVAGSLWKLPLGRGQDEAELLSLTSKKAFFKRGLALNYRGDWGCMGGGV